MDRVGTLPGEKAESVSPGDCFVCIRCGEFLVLEEGLTTKKMNDKELLKIKRENFNIYLQLMQLKATVAQLHN